MTAPFMNLGAAADPEWTCFARPAALGGRTCGHHNAAGESLISSYGGSRLLCCAGCGCTKKASDDRAREAGVAL